MGDGNGAGEGGGQGSGPRKRFRRKDLEEEEEKNEWAALMEADEEDGADAGDQDAEEYVPVHKRREMERQERLRRLGLQHKVAEDTDGDGKPKQSLLLTALQMRKEQPEEDEMEKQAKEEQEILQHITTKKALMGVKELASGVVYTQSIATGWKPPLRVRLRSEEHNAEIRRQLHINVEGDNVPPPIATFEEMRVPRPLCEHLRGKGIQRPTPIQIQGLPVAFAGRDMIGIAFTGSGKTLAFALPLVLAALQEELRMPLVEQEGPIGLCMAPSRELARQTHEILVELAGVLRGGGFPELRGLLAIGGVDQREAFDSIKRGVHMASATPGRLKDMLKRGKVTMDHCRYLCLDEADRMVDLGFEEDIREVLSYFSGQRQTLMFSATMPMKILTFAETALVNPVTVNVSRAGATNQDIIQEVEYVKEENKLEYLLNCLRKTAPPVLIFSEIKSEVDRIHEFLLSKGVEAVAIHGSKSQEERSWAMDQFKAGGKDVLIATDVASKGLDFPAIQHVINFDMPKEIENYVHRIGRTGRAGKTGIASTFINRLCDDSILLDLKHLLKEAKQRIPPVLASLEDPTETAAEVAALTGQRGCTYCGGLGHRITECPKLRAENRAQQREHIGHGGFGGEA
ncbi:unnamed protein product [Pedinophyceae sp. YPF-701]|nr:unnamed protein product [Pedinophyceae sp. YPF-701]